MRNAAGPSLVRLRSVTRAYPRAGKHIETLRHVDVDIREGEHVAVVGPSGSGKTTLANIIGCLDRPSTGQMWIGDRDCTGLGPNERAILRRDLVGFVFQSFNLLPRLSALENVELPLAYRGINGRERADRAVRALTRVGLIERADHLPSQLSGGQQQRVSIARAIATEPRLIIADEPTGALDGETSREIVALLRRINRKRRITLLVVTHDPIVANSADRIIEIRDGRIHGDRRHVEVPAWSA